MPLFDEVKFRVEHNMSPNQTRLTQATELWFSVLCERIEYRLDNIKYAQEDIKDKLEAEIRSAINSSIPLE